MIPAALPVLNCPDGPCNSGFNSRAPREETRSSASAPASATLDKIHPRFQCPPSCAAQRTGAAASAANAIKIITNRGHPTGIVILPFDRMHARRTLVSFNGPSGNSLTDETFNEDYLARLREADAATEAHFSRYFTNVIWLKLRTKIRSPQLIQDIRQETLLRVIGIVRSGRGLDNPERLPAFVHTVCKNVMLEHLRSETRHPQIPEHAPDPVDQRVDVESSIVNDERKKLVKRILEELPERDRTVLRLVFLEEQDKSAVCRSLGVDAGYLRVLLHRAKSRFRKSLQNEDIEH